MNTVYLQEITTIRERGQMTIPQRIREALKIPIEGNVLVKIETTKSGLKLEKLPNASPQVMKKYVTKDIAEEKWQQLSETAKKPNINLTKFISDDRKKH
ncbi:hypothetical protein M1145_00085 [Patescibacteria group bacterium]|nr:hypothetical protein [Patescibacteria group bacterium]